MKYSGTWTVTEARSRRAPYVQRPIVLGNTYASGVVRDWCSSAFSTIIMDLVLLTVPNISSSGWERNSPPNL